MRWTLGTPQRPGGAWPQSPRAGTIGVLAARAAPCEACLPPRLPPSLAGLAGLAPLGGSLPGVLARTAPQWPSWVPKGPGLEWPGLATGPQSRQGCGARQAGAGGLWPLQENGSYSGPRPLDPPRWSLWPPASLPLKGGPRAFGHLHCSGDSPRHPSCPPGAPRDLSQVTSAPRTSVATSGRAQTGVLKTHLGVWDIEVWSQRSGGFQGL